MAFKMKGSPHKMGGIEGTSSHSSALKQKKTTTKTIQHDDMFNLGAPKTPDDKTVITTTTKGRKTKKTTDTYETGKGRTHTDSVTTKRRKDGSVKKVVRTSQGKTDKKGGKTVTRYRKDGSVKGKPRVKEARGTTEDSLNK
tara:strand:+ start:142 stop:564 length:423 start_codon:yes stop_codon:yes gene_type:complete